MSPKKLVFSFINAFSGLSFAIYTQQNLQIQLFGLILAVISSYWLRLDVVSFLLILHSWVLLLVMEMVNTALEVYTDLLEPNYHNAVKTVKNIMAGAVLLTAFSTFIINAIIILPKLINIIVK